MIRLSENVMRLGNRHFNYYVIGSTRAAIVECGVSGGVAAFRQQWNNLTDPKPRIEYLLPMHAHFDHVCGIPALRELFPAAAVTTTGKAQRVLGKASIVEDFFNQDGSMVKILLDEGVLAEAVAIPRVNAIEVEKVVEPGEYLELDPSLRLEIIAAPGHSSDSMAAYLPSDRFLFISDACGFQISDSDIFPIFFQSYPIYIETIKRLQTYPAQILGIPHETIWQGSDIDSFYQRALQAAEGAFAWIRDLTDQGVGENEMRDLLFQRYYVGDLRIYTPANIRICVDLLIKRVQECL